MHVVNELRKNGIKRMILDTDTYNEIDDQFALALAMIAKDKIDLACVCAAPFHNENSSSYADGMERSYREIGICTGLVHDSHGVEIPPYYRGSTERMPDENTPVESEAAHKIAEYVMAYDGITFVTAIGAITNVASAILLHPEIKEKMLCIYDDIYHYMHATTRDLMKFYRGIYPRFDMERYEKLKTVFSEVNEKTPLRSLSKGMLKQSAFWLSMSCRPEILVLDEPVDGLDPVMRRQVWSILMGDVAEEGTTVLLSSHNLRELEDVCDHVGIMHHGKVLLERSLSELQDNILKLQVLFPEEIPQTLEGLEGLDVLHSATAGRMMTYIIRGPVDVTRARMEKYNPLYMEALPLSLEEIFIYELGGMDYAVQDILL